MNNKKGVFLSIDAVIALMLIVALVGVGYVVIRHNKNPAELHYDVLNTLAAVHIGELNDAFVQSLIASGEIADPNKSALEVIGEYYVTNKTRAGQIASRFLDGLETKENLGIWYGSSLIAAKNQSPPVRDRHTRRRKHNWILGARLPFQPCSNKIHLYRRLHRRWKPNPKRKLSGQHHQGSPRTGSKRELHALHQRSFRRRI